MHRRSISFVAAAALMSLAATAAHAEKIDAFKASIYINPDASINVTEKIDYDFESAQKHGIYRDIPIQYTTASGTFFTPFHLISITDENGKPVTSETVDYLASKRIRIGDPKKTISGKHNYTIAYSVEGVFNYFKTHDELYWNVTGNDWDAPINHAAVAVYWPGQFTTSSIKTSCFQGESGSTTVCDETMLSYTTSSRAIGATFQSNNLTPHEGLTIVVGLPTGTVKFAERTYTEVVPDPKQPSRAWLILLPLITFIGMTYTWLRSGRDPKRRGVIIAEYDSPDKLSPGQVGALYDGKADQRDTSAEIIYLAIQGYLTISRFPKNGFFGSDDFEFTQSKKPDDQLTDWQKTILNALFKDGNISRLSKLKYNVHQSFSSIPGDIFASLTTAGYYPESPFSVYLRYGIRGSLIGLVLSLLLNRFDWQGVLAGLATGFIYMFLGFAMVRRTEKGVAAFEHILGFKLYLSVAEKDRINFHNAPDKDPHLFEKFLPYAMVLGVEKAWAGQFNTLYQSEPSWYQDSSLRTINAISLASSLNHFRSTSSKSFYASRSSGGPSGRSGFGGGSSGGGFGGGGGGSW